MRGVGPARRTPEEVAATRADVVDHARAIVRRDGAGAPTTQALAAEAVVGATGIAAAHVVTATDPW